jgi:hypothetical protein
MFGLDCQCLIAKAATPCTILDKRQNVKEYTLHSFAKSTGQFSTHHPDAGHWYNNRFKSSGHADELALGWPKQLIPT